MVLTATSTKSLECEADSLVPCNARPIRRVAHFLLYLAPFDYQDHHHHQRM